MQLIHRTFSIEARADETSRSVGVVASSAAIDSYGEQVLQDWILDRYLANPVVLWNHNTSGGFLGGGQPSDELPIGKASNVGVRGGRLEATLTFIDAKANPLAEKVFQSIRQGSLNAVSVGFRPGRATQVKLPSGDEITELSQNTLFEISVVPLPANPEATVMRTKAAEQREELIRTGAIPTGKSSASARLVRAALTGRAPRVTDLHHSNTPSGRLAAAALRDDDGPEAA